MQPLLSVWRAVTATADNPFLWLSLRQAHRRGEPLRTLASAMLDVVVAATAFLLAEGLMYAASSARAADLFVNIPEAIAFSVLALAHGWTVRSHARRAADAWLQRAAAAGTLQDVLVTRLGAVQMLSQMSVYATGAGLVVVLLGLPAYVFAVGQGTIASGECAAAIAALIACAIVAPAWRGLGLSASIGGEERRRRALYWRAFLVASSLVAGLMIVTAFWNLGTSYRAYQAVPSLHVRTSGHWSPLLDTRAQVLLLGFTAARVLGAARQWFGMPIPLWVWVIPLSVLWQVRAVYVGAAYLVAGTRREAGALVRSGPAPRLLEAVLALLSTVVLGYTWRAAVDGYILSVLTTGHVGNTPAERAAALVVAAGAVSILLGLTRRGGLRPSGRPRAVDLAMPAWPWPLLAALGVVGSTHPQALVSAPMAIAALSLAACGTATIVLSRALVVGSTAWWVAVLVPATNAWAGGPAWAAALCPLATVAALFPGLGRAAADLPPLALLVAGQLAFVALLRGRSVRALRKTAVDGLGRAADPFPPVDTGPAEQPAPVRRVPGHTRGSLARWIRRRVDNPIAALSLTRSVIGAGGARAAAAMLMLTGAMMFGALLVQADPDVALIGQCLFPYAISPAAVTAASIVVVAAALAVLVTARSGDAVARAIVRERQNDTLVFVLAAPMDTRSILAGYCAGPVVSVMAAWIIAAAATLPAAFAAGSDGPILMALAGWTGAHGASLAYAAMVIAGGAWAAMSEVRRDANRGLALAIALAPTALLLMTLRVILESPGRGTSLWVVGIAVATGEVVAAALLWRAALRELDAVRRGDLPTGAMAD